MSASATSKKQCAKCEKGGGIFTCDGCLQSFCGKHVNEHRQELGVELDSIMQEHDSIQQELTEPPPKKSPLLERIDRWEKDSIAKIQAAAETARAGLQEALNKSKEQLSKVCLDITKNLCSSREADDFSEADLTRWKKQLKELRAEIASPSFVKLVSDKSAPIYIMKLTTNESASNDKPPPKANITTSDTQERFTQILGPVSVEESGHLAKYTGSHADFAHVRGRFLYSKGCYVIRFKIERSRILDTQHAVGWFGSNQVYEHGHCASNCKKYGYRSAIESNDQLHLTLDCDKKQIRLYQERQKTTCTLSVNENLAPFPWQFLMVLCNPDDSIRILPNA